MSRSLAMSGRAQPHTPLVHVPLQLALPVQGVPSGAEAPLQLPAPSHAAPITHVALQAVFAGLGV